MKKLLLTAIMQILISFPVYAIDIYTNCVQLNTSIQGGTPSGGWASGYYINTTQDIPSGGWATEYQLYCAQGCSWPFENYKAYVRSIPSGSVGCVYDRVVDASCNEIRFSWNGTFSSTDQLYLAKNGSGQNICNTTYHSLLPCTNEQKAQYSALETWVNVTPVGSLACRYERVIQNGQEVTLTWMGTFTYGPELYYRAYTQNGTFHSALPCSDAQKTTYTIPVPCKWYCTKASYAVNCTSCSAAPSGSPIENFDTGISCSHPNPQTNFDSNAFIKNSCKNIPEICGNNTDENCDGNKDEGCNKDEKTLGRSCSSNIPTDSSANPASGNLYHDQQIGTLTLSYNSLDTYKGILGKGWTHNYNLLLFSNPDNSIGLKQGDGRVIYFRLNQGVYYPEAGSGDTSYIVVNNDNTYTQTLKDSTTYNFNTQGRLISIRDRNGNITALTYNGNDLSGITDASGRTIYITTSNGKITSITTPDNRVYRLTYSGDSLVSVADPELNTWQYTYNQNGMMLTKTDPQGYTTTYTYDTSASGGNKVISSQDPEGKTKTITYDPINQTAQATEKDGGVWTYKYDPLLNVTTQKTDPQGNITTYTYDTNKNLISTKEADGSTTSYTYDAVGNMASVTDPLGNTTAYTYNTFGQITSITDSQGNKTQYTYDANGNPISTTDPSGAITQYQYDSKGNITQLLTPNAQRTTFTYDQFNNLSSVTDSSASGGGSTTTMTYDIAGNITSQTDPNGSITRFEYNNLNQLIKITDPQNNITTYTYDKNGNKTSQTDANGKATYYEYNYRSQITKVTDSLGGITTYTYGGTGCSSCGSSTDKLTAITDAKGNTTTYQYDLSGRLIKETDSLGNIISYSYDSKGNLVSKIDKNTINYTYDSLGRLTKKTYPDNTSEEYRYDSKGNIIYAGNQHIAYNLTYDAKGRITALTDSNSRTITYQYDSMGNRISMTTPEGKVINYTYDTNNRITQILSEAGKFQFIYDSLSRRTKLTLPNGTYTTYSYDTNSRLTNLTHKTTKGSIIDSFTYTHDKVGNRLTKTEPDKKHEYSYDDIYRLIQSLPSKIKHKGKGKEYEHIYEHKAENYIYDAVGNRLTGPHHKDAYTYNNGNQLTDDRHNQYEYDKNGNLTKKTEWHDGKPKIHTYTYDYENRLIKVEIQKYNRLKTVTFKYDPFGRRIEKKVEGNDGTKIYNYVYDNEDIILEYLTKTKDDDGEGKTRITRYTHGLGIDEPLAIEQKGHTYYYHADGLGSIVALTDSKQKVVQTYSYDSFGGFKKHGDKVKDFYTFAGRIWDKDIKLYENRNRFYDPAIGRFITYDPSLYLRGSPEILYLRDAFLYSPQKLNPYLYVNNPVNYIDPFGLSYIEYYNHVNQLVLYNSKGKEIGRYDAANLVINKKVWPDGTYRYSYYKSHPESDENGSYGSRGIFIFNVKGRSGMGVHAGRMNKGGPYHRTKGCVRTTEDAMQDIYNTHFGGDPLTHIIIIR